MNRIEIIEKGDNGVPLTIPEFIRKIVKEEVEKQLKERNK